MAQTSSSRCWVGQAGMPVKRTPCLTMRNSSASVHSPTFPARSGGCGSIRCTAGERGSPGAPWQMAQPRTKWPAAGWMA